MKLPRGIVLFASLAILACADEEQISTSVQPSQSQADAAAILILQELNSAAPACHTTGSPPLNGRAVRVTAKLCLSCKSIGYLLRALATTGDSSPVIVLMPDDHTDSVCEFLKQERAKVSVFTLKEDPRVPTLLSNSILVVEFDSAGNHSSVAARDALSLLAQLGR